MAFAYRVHGILCSSRKRQHKGIEWHVFITKDHAKLECALHFHEQHLMRATGEVHTSISTNMVWYLAPLSTPSRQASRKHATGTPIEMSGTGLSIGNETTWMVEQ